MNRHASKTKTPSVDDIRAKIESLPQELYDEIKALSLRGGAGDCHIGQSYKPPAQLQISHGHRRAFSRAYYGNDSTLMLHNSTGGMMVFGKWIESLSRETLDQLEEYGVTDVASLDDSVDVHLEIAGGMRLRVWCELNDQDGWLRVLRIRLYKI